MIQKKRKRERKERRRRAACWSWFEVKQHTGSAGLARRASRQTVRALAHSFEENSLTLVFRFVHTLFLSNDANFRMKNRLRRNARPDGPLGPGFGCIVEPARYRDYLGSCTSEADVSMFSSLLLVIDGFVAGQYMYFLCGPSGEEHEDDHGVSGVGCRRNVLQSARMHPPHGLW